MKYFLNHKTMQIFSLLLFLFLIPAMGLCQEVSNPVYLSGKQNIVIENMIFKSGGDKGASIYLDNCSNVVIDNCIFDSITSSIGVYMYNCVNVEIKNCDFSFFQAGVHAQSSTQINVHCNNFKNVQGIKSRGQIVQLTECFGGGNKVNYNVSEHEFGTESLINLYKTSGLSSDPIQIIGNQIRGGGILVGENYGHYIMVKENVLVNPGQYGIGAPAGSNIVISNNRVFGKQQEFTNVGIYVGSKNEMDTEYPCEVSAITVTDNEVNWKNKEGVSNGFYKYSACPAIRVFGNNWKSTITEMMLPPVLGLDPTSCPTYSNR